MSLNFSNFCKMCFSASYRQVIIIKISMWYWYWWTMCDSDWNAQMFHSTWIECWLMLNACQLLRYLLLPSVARSYLMLPLLRAAVVSCFLQILIRLLTNTRHGRQDPKQLRAFNNQLLLHRTTKQSAECVSGNNNNVEGLIKWNGWNHC